MYLTVMPSWSTAVKIPPIGALLLVVTTANAQESCRTIGSDWVWFSDHVAFSVDYYVTGPNERQFEVGTGISVNGSVWGATEKSRHFFATTAYGLGAIHVRKADLGEDFEVCVGANRMKVIELCDEKYGQYNYCPDF
jgi:hypothetical protein